MLKYLSLFIAQMKSSFIQQTGICSFNVQKSLLLGGWVDGWVDCGWMVEPFWGLLTAIKNQNLVISKSENKSEQGIKCSDGPSLPPFSEGLESIDHILGSLQ